MIYWTLILLIVAIVAGVFGFTEFSGLDARMAWTLLIGGPILAIAIFITGYKPPRS